MTTTGKNKQESPLTPDDVCRILTACGECDVSVLKFGNLYVKFGQKAKIPAAPAAPSVDSQDPLFAATEIAEIQTEIAKQSLEADEISVKEEQLYQMFIEDPLGAERLLMDGSLENDDQEFNDEEA